MVAVCALAQDRKGKIDFRRCEKFHALHVGRNRLAPKEKTSVFHPVPVVHRSAHSQVALPLRNSGVAKFEGRIVGWLIGGIIGCSLALAVDSLVFHPVWKQELPVSDPPLGLPQAKETAQPLPPPIGSKDPPLRSTPPPMPAPMPMPNPVHHETLRRLEVLGFHPTPVSLAKAVTEGNAVAVTLILKAGVSPDAVDPSGNSALLTACAHGRAAIATTLLDAGADPNAARPGDGFLPLMAASARADLATMERLLLHCAEIDAADAKGHTALHHALFSRQTDAVRWLISRGAPVIGDCCGGTCSLRDHAVQTWDCALLAPILERERHNHAVLWDRAGRDTLYAAIQIADRPMLRLLLQGHDAPPTPQGFRQPLLAWLVAWNYPIAFRLLLDCGADPNTPISSPVEPVFAKLIPEDPCRFYVQKEPGMNVLMLASGLGRMDYVRMLLDHGAKRGAVSGHYKMAAIQFAARARQPEVCQVLLGKSPLPADQRVRIEISLGAQRAVLWKDDRPVLRAPISTGRTGFPTPSGRFVVTDKEPNRYSTLYKVNMPWFMRLSCSEFGMHAGVVPNYPASHGCIRLPPGAALSFYKTVDVGTLVTISP